MVQLFNGHGEFLCNVGEKKRLKEVIWLDGTNLRKEVVGQYPSKNIKLTGIADCEKVIFLMFVGKAVGKEDMFSGE